MALPVIGDTGTILEVDAASKAARAILYAADGNPLVLADKATQNATRKIPGIPITGLHRNVPHTLHSDAFGRLEMGHSEPHLQDGFEGATLNTNIWVSSVGTMTTTQAQGQVTMNAAASLASGGHAILTTVRRFPLQPRKTLATRWRSRATWFTNGVMEWGFGGPATTVAETNDTCGFRLTGTGQSFLYSKWGANSEATSADLGAPLTLFDETKYYDIDVSMSYSHVAVRIQEVDGAVVLDARLPIPASQQASIAQSHVGAFTRVYTTGITLTAAQLFHTNFLVETLDMDMHRDAPQLAALTHRGGHVSPTLYTQTANYANTIAPVSATLSNTVAGYLTLGGQWQFIAVAGAETDYALFAFTVPTGFTLLVHGVRISTFNMGAAVATTPTLLQWGLGANGATANLSTGAFHRVATGAQSLPVGAAIGAAAAEVVWNRASPLITESARVFAVILKMPVATATGSQIVRGTVEIDGFFE
jgi:hypothetical protein